VSGKGVVELQAQLYRAQEQARLQAESGGADRVQDRHVRRKAGVCRCFTLGTLVQRPHGMPVC
jgi:hypothetical protein